MKKRVSLVIEIISKSSDFMLRTTESVIVIYFSDHKYLAHFLMICICYQKRIWSLQGNRWQKQKKEINFSYVKPRNDQKGQQEGETLHVTWMDGVMVSILLLSKQSLRVLYLVWSVLIVSWLKIMDSRPLSKLRRLFYGSMSFFRLRRSVCYDLFSFFRNLIRFAQVIVVADSQTIFFADVASSVDHRRLSLTKGLEFLVLQA